MTTTHAVEELKQKANALSPDERAELAYHLLSSLDTESEVGAAEAWRQEIHQRVLEIRSGKAVGRPVEDVLAELRELYP